MARRTFDPLLIEEYLGLNVAALLRIVRENGITAIHANHSVMMSEVARRASVLRSWTAVVGQVRSRGLSIEGVVQHRTYRGAAWLTSPGRAGVCGRACASTVERG